MSKPVEVSDTAQGDLHQAIDWHMKAEPRAVAGFLGQYERALAKVGNHSASLAEFKLGTKRCLFESDPYQLIIRDLPTSVQIISVSHLKRKPGYWKSRIR